MMGSFTCWWCGDLRLSPHARCTREAKRTLEKQREELSRLRDPVPMILHCPSCHSQHIDKGEWAILSHRTHLCEHCGNKWRPSDRATVGAESLPCGCPLTCEFRFSTNPDGDCTVHALKTLEQPE